MITSTLKNKQRYIISAFTTYLENVILKWGILSPQQTSFEQKTK